MYKALSETHATEVLSDNTQFQKCEQCRECVHWGKSESYFENTFDKSCCRKYPYPDHKPIDVINNRTVCEFRKVENE